MTAAAKVRRRRLPFAIVAPHVIRDPSISVNARLLYAVLCTYANEYGNCWPSVSTVLEGLGMSDRTRRRAQSELVEAGVLTITTQLDSRGRRTLNLYTLTDMPEGTPARVPGSDPGTGAGGDGGTGAGGTPARAPGSDPGTGAGTQHSYEQGRNQEACEHGRKHSCPYCPGGRLAYLEERRA